MSDPAEIFSNQLIDRQLPSYHVKRTPASWLAVRKSRGQPIFPFTDCSAMASANADSEYAYQIIEEEA